MNVRNIQHPGVETREIDLSQYFNGPNSVNINNAYVMGFTDKGPIYDYTWLTSQAQFIAIYGQPTNEAERYLFYAVESILANGGNPIVARMPYDNKQCKTYKGLTLTYGTMGSSVGVYNDVSTASNALINLEKVSNFIGTRIKDNGLQAQIFPRFADIEVTTEKPHGYILWQVLSLIKATLIDVQILANASNYMKWEITPTAFPTMSEAFKTWGTALKTIFENLGITNSDFAALYNEFKSYFSSYTMKEQLTQTVGFNFSHVKFIHPENVLVRETSGYSTKQIFTNGITLSADKETSFKTGFNKKKLTEVYSGISASFNKVFLATTPGYVVDMDLMSKDAVASTSGLNTTQQKLDISVRDLLINLCPTFEDNIVYDGEEYHRGEVENFMGFKIGKVGTNSELTAWDQLTNINDLSARMNILGATSPSTVTSSVNYVKYTGNYTSYWNRFTINGQQPSVLNISSKAISGLYSALTGITLTSTSAFKATELVVSSFFDDPSGIWKAFYEDEKYHCADIARIYNDPVFYKATNQATASIDAMLLKQPEVGFENMVCLASKDVELTNSQYDALVTTNNFEAEPDSEVYGQKINKANFCIVDKLKTVANGTQANEGYFITIIDPFDALKLQRLLVNPYENVENTYDNTDIQYWGAESNMAWSKKFETAIDTCDTLARVKNADGIYVGQPGAGNKTNVLDSWSYPLTASYKNDSVSKTLMQNFGQIPLNSTSTDGESCIDKCYSSHIVVAVCRTGVNPADGKITVNVVESFFGSIFDEYDEATGATLYIGNLINENSNYIEFYKNEYIQPKFGGINSKSPYNKTTVNQFFIKDSAALVKAAAQVGVNTDDYDINEDFSPENNKHHFTNKALLEAYLNEHADDTDYPPEEGRYYFLIHQSVISTSVADQSNYDKYTFTTVFHQQTYAKAVAENGTIISGAYFETDSAASYADPTCDVIAYVDVTYRENSDGNLGIHGRYHMSPVYTWKKSYDAFAEACRRGNINIFNKKKTCLYNLYQTAYFTSFSQKECEKKIANTTGIYSPVYGESTKTASNFVKDMDYCIKFIQNVDAIPIYFVADAGISTIAQFCDNINWDANTQKWITQSFDPDNDPDAEDKEISSFDDCATWRKVVEKLDYISRVVRKDCMTIIDAPRQMTLDGQAPKIRPSAWDNDFDEVIGKKLRFISGLNSSYTAGYLTWFRTTDKFTGKAFWLPPTCKLIGNLVYLNAINLPWLAPAGVMYGRINGVHAISLNPCSAEEDQIYLKNWNYCKQYPTEGFIIEGQKTTLTKNSAFNRINVRTLFLDLERFVTNVGRTYRYKVNNQFTRQQFVQTIKPKFEDYTTRGGLYEYLIKCDDTLNTAEVIDNNELRAAIYIKPARLIEYILIDMVCTKSGAVLSEITY